MQSLKISKFSHLIADTEKGVRRNIDYYKNSEFAHMKLNPGLFYLKHMDEIALGVVCGTAITLCLYAYAYKNPQVVSSGCKYIFDTLKQVTGFAR